jgi:hypothetical protein
MNDGQSSQSESSPASELQSWTTQPHVDRVSRSGSDATAGPLAKQEANLGITAQVLGGDGACTDNMTQLAGSAIGNVTRSEAGLALSKMPKGQDFDKRYVARFRNGGTLGHH